MKKEPAQTVITWLRANLGRRALAPLTGTDTLALKASVQIAEVAAQTGVAAVGPAWAQIVSLMQPSTRGLAVHAVAHALDWSDRARFTAFLNVEWQRQPLCAFEPGGSMVDQ